MLLGNTPRDNGGFLLDQEERDALLRAEPKLAQIIRPFMGAYEFINNINRYCLWLSGVSPSLYAHSKAIMDRISKVRAFRSRSIRETTARQADFPTLFSEIRQPDTDYILIPLHSSEKRRYIPIGFMGKEVICSNANAMIPSATLYEFGVITSTMHMVWTRYVCGRLKSDYRYSGVIVYNNFPWPTPTGKQRAAIEKAAQAVLDARQIYPDLPLATLYNPDTMLPELVKAHQRLDKAVEKAYGREFNDDAQRVAYLFALYQKLSGELFVDSKKRGKGKKV
jgi:hypothetical protein